MKILIAGVLMSSIMSLSACQAAGGTSPIDGLMSFAAATPNKSDVIKAGHSTTSKKPFDSLIRAHARKNGVPIDLAHAVVQLESNYNAKARGAAGEVGLMQIKPATARGMGYTGSTKALYTPETNIKYGMKYLGEAYKRGGKTTCGAILKYNAGHYAKRMNPVSAKYCQRVKAIIN